MVMRGTVCNWMVVGERHDDHMKSINCDIADNNGRIVLEYLDSENDNDGKPGRRDLYGREWRSLGRRCIYYCWPY